MIYRSWNTAHEIYSIRERSSLRQEYYHNVSVRYHLTRQELYCSSSQDHPTSLMFCAASDAAHLIMFWTTTTTFWFTQRKNGSRYTFLKKKKKNANANITFLKQLKSETSQFDHSSHKNTAASSIKQGLKLKQWYQIKQFKLQWNILAYSTSPPQKKNSTKQNNERSILVHSTKNKNNWQEIVHPTKKNIHIW